MLTKRTEEATKNITFPVVSFMRVLIDINSSKCDRNVALDLVTSLDFKPRYETLHEHYAVMGKPTMNRMYSRKQISILELLLFGCGWCAVVFLVFHCYLEDALLHRPNEQDSSDFSLRTNFRFPSIDERVEYYMGCWANVQSATSHYLGDKNQEYCDDITRQADLEELDSKELALWHIEELPYSDQSSYAEDSHSIMQDSNLVVALFQFGDVRLARNMELPVITKTRLSRWAIDKETCGNIIWPLKMRRHYHPVEQVHQYRMEGLESPWQEKTETLIWRGHDMDPNEREFVVTRWYHYDVSTIDIGFAKYGDDDDDDDSWLTYKVKKYGNIGYDMRPYARPSMTIQEMIQYKYLLSTEGADVSTSLKWMLYANSVVFMRVPMVVSFAMEDLLVPFVHYIPVADDYSDLAQMVEWAKANDEKCRFIAQQSTEYIERLWMSQQAQEEYRIIKKRLGDLYRDSYEPKLQSCFPNERIHPKASNRTFEDH